MMQEDRQKQEHSATSLRVESPEGEGKVSRRFFLALAAIAMGAVALKTFPLKGKKVV